MPATAWPVAFIVQLPSSGVKPEILQLFCADDTSPPNSVQSAMPLKPPSPNSKLGFSSIFAPPFRVADALSNRTAPVVSASPT